MTRTVFKVIGWGLFGLVLIAIVFAPKNSETTANNSTGVEEESAPQDDSYSGYSVSQVTTKQGEFGNTYITGIVEKIGRAHV